jgi:hypothetical protein
MQQLRKTRQAVKRAAEDSEASVPVDSLSDTSDAAELLARLDEVLSESR